MSRLIDLTGQRFGRLTVIERAEDHIQPTGKHETKWRCVCDCGNITVAYGGSLRNGGTKSCGCLQREIVSQRHKRHKRHGDSKTRLYNTWNHMLYRCYNPKHKNYHRYGGRGITVCEEWKKYENFRDWAMANGYQEDLSIDRVDVNGSYCPENCRWVTQKEQTRNRSSNCIITLNGESKILIEWCELYGMNYGTVSSRLSRGWTPEEVLVHLNID